MIFLVDCTKRQKFRLLILKTSVPRLFDLYRVVNIDLLAQVYFVL